MLHEIGPGQALRQALALEPVARELPGRCSGYADATTTACVARVLPPPGNYEIEVQAFAQLSCAPARDVGRALGPGEDCRCQPDGEGWCSHPGARSTLLTPPLTFTLPTDDYFQDQELEIAAP